MPKFIVSAAIAGDASCLVEADSAEEAIEAAKGADGWKIDDWDLNLEEYRGGWIDAQEDT